MSQQEGHSAPVTPEESQRQQAKKDFLSGMNHALKTPLNVILGFSELGQRATDDPALAMYFGTIRSAGVQLLDMLTDLLDFSRAQRGDYTPSITWFSLPEILREVSRAFTADGGESGLSLRLVEMNTSYHIESDPTILRRVIERLLSNANQYSPADSPIELNVSVSTSNDGRQGHVEVRVTDQGSGVPESIQEHLFEGLERGEHVQARGPGLGLALSRVQLEVLGGRIALASSSSSGSTFSVSLPVRLRPLETGEAGTRQNVQPVNLVGRVILVVDDAELNRIMIREMLAETGADLVEAADGRAALRVAEERHIDVALLDIEMPVMDGWETARKLKERHAQAIALVAISGHPLASDPRSRRFDVLLEKPLDQASLVSSLARLLPAAEPSSDEDRFAASDASVNAHPSGITLDDESRAALLRTLRNSRAEVDALRANQSITLIEIFGKRMAAAAQQAGYGPLLTWANRLSSQAFMFDIDKMNTTLSQFESFILELENAHG